MGMDVRSLEQRLEAKNSAEGRDILRGGGVSPADITKVHKAALTHFLDELLAVWQIAFAGESLAGGWVILTRSYGLDGNAPGVTAPT